MLKKVLIILVVLLVLLVASFMYFSSSFIKFNNTPKGSNHEVLESTSSKKALIIYQPSKSDATSKIAHSLAKGINEAGYEVTLDYPGEQLSVDLSQYSVIAFGSPVYAQQTSSILNDYVKKAKIQSTSKVILFSTGSMGTAFELDSLEKQLSGVKAIEKQKFKYPFSNDTEGKAYEFGSKVAKVAK